MLDLHNYPMGTRIGIGSRVFRKVAPSSFWREEHSIPGNCVSRPATSIQNIEQQLGQTHLVIGFFVDWDGNTRRTEAPGSGYTCQLVEHANYLGVDVIDHEGFVCHEAVYYPTQDALRAVGVTVNLVE